MSRSLDKSSAGLHRKQVVAAGARLLAYCAERGLTKAELAEKLGVHPSACSRWFTGARSPYPTLRVRIEKVTGIPASAWRTETEVRWEDSVRARRRKSSS